MEEIFKRLKIFFLFSYLSIFCIFVKILFIFRERGKEGERQRKKHRCERETLIGCLAHASNMGPGLQLSHAP